MIEAAITAIGALLAALSPDIVKAITGGQTADEAIASARAAAAKVPDRTEQADEDLAERKARG
jgi:hypothetical protein